MSPTNDRERNMFIAVCCELSIQESSIKEITNSINNLRQHEYLRMSDQEAEKVLKKIVAFTGNKRVRKMRKLTEGQVCRQNLVDGAIQDMIYKCIEGFFAEGQCFVKHDLELSGDIRDIVQMYIEKYDLPVTEQEFYPSAQEDYDDSV